MAPIERFKGNYANHRYNPFTDADMAVDKTEDNIYIPGSSPFTLQLLELPRKNDPSSVSIYNYDDGGAMTEVVTSPTQGQFRVDYPSPDGKGTGLIEFNQNDAGKRIKMDYKATGSPIVAEFLDTKVSYPASSPGENQVVIFKSGAPAWANNPVRYFHEGDALYHASGESESCLLFRFKKDANQSKALLELKGAKVHQGRYSEIPSHLHEKGTLVTAQDAGGHSHSVPHSHGVGTLAGAQPTHVHRFYASEGMQAADTEAAGGDAVTISGSSAEANPSTSSVEHHCHNIAGSTAATGTTPKTYPDQLKVYLDGVDKTANILSLSGLDKLGDGTDTHSFVTAGTGELDIAALLAGGTFHEIKITEPIAARGGRALLHLEVY